MNNNYGLSYLNNKSLSVLLDENKSIKNLMKELPLQNIDDSRLMALEFTAHEDKV